MSCLNSIQHIFLGQLQQSQTFLQLIVIYEGKLISRKLWATLKYMLTLEIGRNTVMHSHRWQILCKRMEN